MRGVIRRYSGLPKLRKPIFAFPYSRLSTWANTIDEGLNPARSFNLVSAARNRPSGNPTCELFPQGPIIPVPPSTPPCRPIGALGNNLVVFPGRNAKRKPSNQGVRGLLFPLFRWRLCSEAMPKQYQCPSPPCIGKNSPGRVSGPARWLVLGRRGNPRLDRGASGPGGRQYVPPCSCDNGHSALPVFSCCNRGWRTILALRAQRAS